MGGLQVVSRNRFGHRCLYVTEADGARVGWVDLSTCTVTVEHPERRAEFDEVLESYLRRVAAPPPVGALPRQLRRQANRPGAASTVAAGLADLRGGWRVVDSLPIGERGGDVEHLLIGPPGVFVLSSKHHPDANVWVAGNVARLNSRIVHWLRDARHEARRAATLLGRASGRPVRVEPIVVVVGARRLEIREHPPGVAVLAHHALGAYLGRLPWVLSPYVIGQIHAAAARPDTWTPPAA
jgi:hypothetical protein